MPRNFFRRIEVLFPVEDGNLRERIRGEILETILQDNVKARILQKGGSYRRPRPRGAVAHRSQYEFIKMAKSPGPVSAAPGKSAQRRRFKLAPNPFTSAPT
jgi:polyphosphate kinase